MPSQLLLNLIKTRPVDQRPVEQSRFKHVINNTSDGFDYIGFETNRKKFKDRN
jgi:hypothetical protein